MEFEDLDGLIGYINTSIEESLKDDVFEKVRETERRHIQKDVYEAYDPKVYERRKDKNFNESLASPENIQGELLDKTTLVVSNETEPNPFARDGATTDKNLPEVIEYGRGYDYPGKGAYSDPRPFTKNTVDELRETKAHVLAIKEGLVKRGIDVK